MLHVILLIDKRSKTEQFECQKLPKIFLMVVLVTSATQTAQLCIFYQLRMVYTTFGPILYSSPNRKHGGSVFSTRY